MRAFLPVLLLALPYATAAPVAAQDTVIDTELLIAHPSLQDGDYDLVREDWFAALESSPDAKAAYFVMQRIVEMNDWCAAPLATARIADLQRHVLDPKARALLATMQLEGQRRDRAAGSDYSGNDIFHEWLTEWRVAGPWGRADAVEPLAELAPLDGLDWRPLRRPANRNWITPDEIVFPAVGGIYTAVLVRSDAKAADLMLDADERCMAWWNGERILTALREDAYGSPQKSAGLHGQHHHSPGGESSFRLPIEFIDGWNVLLIATPADSDLYVGARFLREDGSPMTVEQMPADREYPLAGLPGAAPARVNLRTNYRYTRDSMKLVRGMVAMRLEGRADRALGMAVNLPELTEAISDSDAWLSLTEHYLAVQSAYHLPSDIARARMIALEDALIERDLLGPRIGYARAERMLEEDRPEEALELLTALQAKFPGSWYLGSLEVDALETLDPYGTLARARLLELHAQFPQRLSFAARLRELASAAGAPAEAERWAKVCRKLGAYGSSNWSILLDRAQRRDDGETEKLKVYAQTWMTDEPRNGTAEWMLLDILEAQGDEQAILANYAADKDRYGLAPYAAQSLADKQLELGRSRAEASASLREAIRLQPGLHEARALLDAMGTPADDAEEFFREFGPDVETALAQRGTATGASTALLLDHGMVYLLPDGAYQYRTHVLSEALDRAGTEALHEQWAQEYPLITRVHDVSGKIFEPHQVEGSWVMPSLDPGDVIEQIYDRFVDGIPGVTPVPGSWRFASFSEPFLLTRWVLYVPDGLEGEFREGQFDGARDEVRWNRGTVYSFEQRDSARIEPEVLMPSELEILPWVEFGADKVASDHLRSWYRWLLWQTTVPEDIALELDEFVATHAGDGVSLARAEALYTAMGVHVIDFSGGGDVTDVWTQRRGDPTGLYAALLDRAGVHYEWALTTGVAPELDSDPVRAFANGEEFGLPLMRIEGSDGRVVWLRPDVRGAAFGELTSTMAGAEVAVLGGAGLTLESRIEELPRGGDQDTWNLDFKVRYTLEGLDALGAGRIRITGADGMQLREQLSQAPPEQLQAVARQICAGLVEGMDLESADFPGIQDAGAPLVLDFNGRIPGFVRVNNSGVAGARLRVPELGLSAGLGAAERKLPFAFRNLIRLRAVIELDCAGAWTLEYGPEARTEQRDGFRYDFQVDKQDGELRIERFLELRGLILAAEEFPGFLGLLAEIEKEESRAVKLSAVSE